MDKYILVEYLSAINTVIHNTFQTTQRIKFTAFDVSGKYIIFGVNSGGIYIFGRESCQFLKLIPSHHGSANLLLISEDETSLAVAVSTGLVIILEDCFDANMQQQVFSEHEGHTVTAMKWNGNDLYCGDSTGRLSVITLKSFLTKAMFQPPIACLMHLDSQIVQLDTHSKFLLVSTLTRTLLCDTETERYRQIGKKTRDGPYGGCFLNVDSDEDWGVIPHARGTFQTVGESEELSLNQINTNVKIYCSRPGTRLWQADFQANVIYTHQFRQSLNQKQADIIYWNDLVDSDLKISASNDTTLVGEIFNFGKIFRFLNKFVLTFKDDGFYIFEPSSSALLFWRHLSNIKDIKIINSVMYIWHRDLEVSIISLLSVEELILRSLFKKQYTLCGQFCVRFLDEVQSLIGPSKKIHLISVLERKLDNSELLNKLSPVFQRLKDCSKSLSLEKFKNGIVNVNNYPITNLPESVENFKCDIDTKKGPRNIILEQYRIHKIHKNIETTDFKALMQSLNIREIYDSIMNFDPGSDCEFWRKEMFLKYLKNPQELDAEMLEYACEAFLLINDDTKDLVCKCNFPLPKAHKSIPKNYEIGCKLMEKSEDYEMFLKNVPYMHKNILDKIDNSKEIQLKISLIIQYSDPTIIKTVSNKIPYDVWDDSIQLLGKLKTGHCLHCGGKIDPIGTLQWKDFGISMVQSIKATNTIKLFKRYTHLLPKGEIDEFFYQYCIFSSVSNINSDPFNEIFHNERVKKQFEISVGGYLRKRYLRGSDYDPPIANKSPESVPDCDHCHLPLKIPIIEDTTRLNCGHCYHKVCFLYYNKRCSVCDPVL